jgi:hypothetical protein
MGARDRIVANHLADFPPAALKGLFLALIQSQ